ncbi:MAG: hypothetical protein CL949_12405 [Erythrobacter sp.]|nr:hypothetical protein [Erythrobacter sp.]
MVRQRTICGNQAVYDLLGRRLITLQRGKDLFFSLARFVLSFVGIDCFGKLLGEQVASNVEVPVCAHEYLALIEPLRQSLAVCGASVLTLKQK